jgi:fucose 4-O-acetylase-like acetyltransferase
MDKIGASRHSIPEINVARGIGIALVVFGHLNDGTFLRNCIYLFHMPLFFFLSGYLYKVQTDHRLFLKKKFIHLMIPYFTFLLLYAPLEYKYHHGENHALLRTLGALVWGGDSLRGSLAIFWFVSCLFLTQQLMNWLMNYYRLRIVMQIAAVAFVLSYVNSMYAPWFKLPFDAHVVLAAMPFFLLGYMARSFDLKQLWVRLVATAGAFGGAVLVYSHSSVAYDMRGGVYGWPFVSFLLALSGTVLVMFISDLISRTRWLGFFGSLGVLSMGVMFVHLEVRVILGVHRLQKMNPVMSLGVVLTTAYLVAYLISKFSLTRGFMTGSQEDVEKWLKPIGRIRLTNTLRSQASITPIPNLK